ncbi:MAG: PDZ domain-containing protein [Salinivenus sp.]
MPSVLRPSAAVLGVALLLLFVRPVCAQDDTRLLREPSVQNDTIVFSYANDVWVVSTEGGDAERLTSFPGTESQPHLSPDGQQVAFTGQYDGDTDVYVVSVDGGQPERLTHHPSADHVRGWTPDGKVLFQSRRQGGPRLKPQFWTVDPDSQGLPERVPVPRAHFGTMDSDGQRLAYELVDPWDPEWRNYRGGQAQPIRILDLETMDLEKVPWDGERHKNPVWLGDTIYFLSERDRAMNVWAYDTAADSLWQVTSHDTYDVKGIAAGDGTVVYEQAGYLHRYDPATESTQKLSINVRGDLPWTRPDWKDVDDQIRTAALSPTGERALFEARGEIFTVPTEHGDPRNLTESSGAADRSPAWSPDGQRVAWFSDASGEYQLYLSDQKGLEEPERFDLPGPTFYYDLAWAPNGSHVLFTDANRTLWTLDVETGETTEVDTDPYATPERAIDPEWSPDGEWIAYAKRQDNLHYAVMLYSVETGDTTQVATDLVDTRSPTWDPDGDFLYFLGSTDLGLNTGWLDMSSYGRPATHGLYAAVLSDDGSAPLRPRSDEESAREDEESDEDTAPDEDDTVAVDVDLNGLSNRVVSLGEPKRIYSQLRAGPSGTLFYVEEPQGDGSPILKKYAFEERESTDFLEGVGQYRLSHDRNHLLYQAGDTWGVVPTSASPSVGDGALELDLEARITPPEEWAQIFREAWRFQRDYFYVENLHGADWPTVYERYEPWLEHAQHREDLNYVLDVMGGEISVGHSYTGGGDMPETDDVSVGLLGADLQADQGYYRFAQIYDGEPWTDAEGPLAAPGVNVSEGDYLIAVDGTEVTTDDNPYAAFEETAEEQVLLTVNDEPTADGAREVTVVPIDSEAELRRIAWIEHNREVVDSLSDGRLGYVYIPDTGDGGYERFTRNYFSQQDKDGMIIDERYNGGGSAADYMVNIMSRELHGYFNNPVGEKTPFTSPGAGVWGPKVMIINEMAGSGGDYLPYLFRKMEIGPLVGTRTWGGLVGIWGTPPLVDGGSITAPRGGFFTTEGEWAIENEGVAPDIEVEMTPRLVEEGEDPQLRQAVETGLERLETERLDLIEEPPAPTRVQRPSDGQ